jgi:hypothetical protein
MDASARGCAAGEEPAGALRAPHERRLMQFLPRMPPVLPRILLSGEGTERRQMVEFDVSSTKRSCEVSRTIFLICNGLWH